MMWRHRTHLLQIFNLRCVIIGLAFRVIYCSFVLTRWIQCCTALRLNTTRSSPPCRGLGWSRVCPCRLHRLLAAQSAVSRSRCKHWYSVTAADKRCRSTSADRFWSRISSERVRHDVSHPSLTSLPPPPSLTHSLAHRLTDHTRWTTHIVVCTRVFDQLNAFLVIILSQYGIGKPIYDTDVLVTQN